LPLKNIKSAVSTCEMLLEHQISILQWFLKEYVTLKTGIMMLNILCFTWIHFILKKKTLILHCNNILQDNCFTGSLIQSNSNNVSLGEHYKLLLK